AEILAQPSWFEIGPGDSFGFKHCDIKKRNGSVALTHGGPTASLRSGLHLELRNCYFASSVARVSRMTVTRICPGYVMSVSILRATSRASIEVSSSEIWVGSTIT